MDITTLAQLAQLGAAGAVLATVILFLRYTTQTNKERSIEREQTNKERVLEREQFLDVITNHLSDARQVQSELVNAIQTLAHDIERWRNGKQ